MPRIDGPAPGKVPLVEKGWDPETRTWSGDSPVGKLLAALRAGNFKKAAANYAEVGERTLYAWQAIGQEHDPGSNGDWSSIPPAKAPYVQLLYAIQKAEADSEVGLVTIIRSAVREDPKLALAMLGRRHRAWRENRALDVTVNEGQQQDRVAKAVDADPNLAMKAQEFAMAAGSAVVDDDDAEDQG